MKTVNVLMTTKPVTNVMKDMNSTNKEFVLKLMLDNQSIPVLNTNMLTIKENGSINGIKDAKKSASNVLMVIILMPITNAHNYPKTVLKLMQMENVLNVLKDLNKSTVFAKLRLDNL